MFTKINMPLVTVSAISLATSLTIATPATAKAGADTAFVEPHATVSAADLDLNSPAGMRRLTQRVKGAATRLCLTNNVEPIETLLARSKCYHTALSSGQRRAERKSAADVDRTKLPDHRT